MVQLYYDCDTVLLREHRAISGDLNSLGLVLRLAINSVPYFQALLRMLFLGLVFCFAENIIQRAVQCICARSKSKKPD